MGMRTKGRFKRTVQKNQFPYHYLHAEALDELRTIDEEEESENVESTEKVQLFLVAILTILFSCFPSNKYNYLFNHNISDLSNCFHKL